MTNEQAKALAEKVWPNTNVLIRFEITAGIGTTLPRYSLFVHKTGDFHGRSFEEAFLAAGVEVCDCAVCEGTGELIEAVQAWDIPGAPIPTCTHCVEGLGYRLLEPKGER